jgi:flagellar basal body P-ring formation protein FlgA
MRTHVWVIAVLVAAMAACAAGETAKLAVTLRADAVSAGEQILLSEIAALPGWPAEQLARGQQVAIGRAALPAQTRTLTAQEIANALKRAGFTEKIEVNGEPSVAVTAASQTITGERLTEIAANAVRAYFAQDADLEAEVIVSSTPGDVLLRPGPVSLDAELPDSGPRPGTLSVRVRVSQNGRRIAEPVAGVLVHVTGSLPVASERLLAGEILGEAGVKLVRRELSAGELASRCTPARLVGMRAKKIIAADEPLTRGLFAAPQVIHRGEAITIVVKRGDLELAARGEARNDAALDEPVRVLVQDSSAEVIARASGAREATLDDPNDRAAR